MSRCAIDVHRNVTNWCEKYPETARALDDLGRRHVRCAVFSGTVAVWHGVREQTSDTDVLVHPEDFDAAVEILGARVEERVMDIATGDGQKLWYIANEATATRDGVEIQVMNPLTSMQCGDEQYALVLTELALANRTLYVVGDAEIAGAHPFDTIGFKTAAQRRAPNHDVGDCRGLARVISPDDPYVAVRAAEMGLDRSQRAIDFLAGIGCALSLEPAIA